VTQSQRAIEQRALGRLSVSVIGIGGNNFGQRFGADQTREVVLSALECGINFFDTSDSYGDGASEECLGYALRDHRDEAIVATKYDGAPDTVREHCLASLSRLNMEVIDLYQIHRPYLEAPLEETLGALGELVSEGIVREIGCSNFGVAQLKEARSLTREGHVGFVCVQNDYNLLNRKQELDVIPYCDANNIAFHAYFPLYHGLLTGKFCRNETPPTGTRLANASEARREAVFSEGNFDIVERLIALAERHGTTLLDLAISRLIHVSGVSSVITGAMWPDQVRANARAAKCQFDEELYREIDAIAPTCADARDTPSAARGIA